MRARGLLISAAVQTLLAELRRRFPGLDGDAAGRLVAEGRVLVNGFPVRNPQSRVGREASLRIVTETALRGEAKLKAALERFSVPVARSTALDAGAAAGGFTRALLEAGASRVYAVDAGHGQLLGSLRRDARVVNLEGTNIGELSPAHVPEPLDLVTLDLSYLSLTRALPQLERCLTFALEARLVALVKPMFELALPRPPSAEPMLARALERAEQGIAAAGWRVLGSMRSPVRGARGAVEFFVDASRA